METLFGLPAHPLLVHVAVVLIPLVAVALVVIALVPRWRARFALPVFVAAVASAIYLPLVTSSGEGLEEILGEEGNAVIETHAELGDTAVFIGVLLALAAALVWWVTRQQAQGRPVARVLTAGVTVVALLVGLGATVQVARIGHTGATAAWGDAGAEEE